MPGQTITLQVGMRVHYHASMEGRAIARPNTKLPTIEVRLTPLQWRAGQLPGQTGVTIPPARSMPTSFNGGPGNCPAKPAVQTGRLMGSRQLQWRAGQLPGQTARVPMSSTR